MNQDIRSKIQTTPECDACLDRLANTSIRNTADFGLTERGRSLDHPSFSALVYGRKLPAVDNWVGLEEAALLRSTHTYALAQEKQKLFRQSHTMEPARRPSQLKDCVLPVRLRIRALSHNTLVRATSEAISSWRQVSSSKRPRPPAPKLSISPLRRGLAS